MSVGTGAVTLVTATGAQLNGDLFNIGGWGGPDTVGFQWGLTNAYGNLTAFSSTNIPGLFSSSLAGALLPNHTYHFKAVADDGHGGQAFGIDMKFTTLSGVFPAGDIPHKLISGGLI